MSSKRNSRGASKKSSDKRSEATAAAGGPGGLVDHEPIIITGGSTQIEFGRQEYTQSGDDQVGHADLRLKAVRARHDKHDDGRFECHELEGNEVCVIRVHCRRPQHDPRIITISGGLNRSPVINFDHGEFKHIKVTKRRKIRGSSARKIFKLEIFRLKTNGQTEDKPFHECPLIPANGKCSYEIDDSEA